MNNNEIQSILHSLGERVPPASQLMLIGGSALALLGSPRLTIDIDFVGDDLHPTPLHRTLMQVARELKIHLEPVPLEQFIPMPSGNENRNIRIGQFGNLEIYVVDPYSIALSKLDRGLETDFEDLLFLIRNNFISMPKLEHITKATLSQARQFDLDPNILDHLAELRDNLK